MNAGEQGQRDEQKAEFGSHKTIGLIIITHVFPMNWQG
jgi:hypothetical protein